MGEAHSVQHVLWGTQGGSHVEIEVGCLSPKIWDLPRQGGYFTGENDENQSELEVPTGRSSLPVEIPIIGRR